MTKSRLIALSVSMMLASDSMLRVRVTPSSTRGLTVIKPNKKPSVTPKKSVKPKGRNYTSKMKAKPNTVRKDFNQRRR